jgi:hypothetical protein
MQEELRQLLSDYFELESEVKAHEYGMKEKRERIRELVSEMPGQKTHVDHIASVQIVPESVSHSYDTKALDGLVQIMIADGEIHTAKRIMSCRKETKRAESMRITPAKGR